MAGFTPTIQSVITDISKESLVQLAPSVKAFCIGTEQGQKKTGDKIRVFFNGTPEDATDFDDDTNDYETATAPDVDYKDVALGIPMKITKEVTKQQLRSGLQLKTLLNGMVRKTILGSVNKSMSVITIANFGAPIHYGAASTVTSDLMADLSGSAADLGWEDSSLHAVLKTSYYGNLVKDDDLKTLWGPEAGAMVRSGIVPTLSGFTAYRYPTLPTNSQNLVGFITDGTGIVLAFAENELEMGVEKHLEMNEVVRDEATGLIVSIRLLGSAGKNKAFLTTEVLPGFSVGRAAGLKRITSQADA